jgi:hypothetical protein
MSQQASPSSGPRQHGITESLQAFMDAVLGKEITWQHWVVLVRNQTSGEEHERSYLASSPDEAETLAHHAGTQYHGAGFFFVQALRIAPRRALWDVRLQGRAKLRQALPSGMPLLVGRIVSASEEEARQQAIAAHSAIISHTPRSRKRLLQTGC